MGIRALIRLAKHVAVGLLATLYVAAPLCAQAQTSFSPPLTGTVTVGVPAAVSMPISLEITTTMLSNLDPGTVLYSTSDGLTILYLNSLGFGNDGIVTVGELSTQYPNAKITISGFNATLTGDARFTLDASACAAPAGTTCTAYANFSGAIPAGVANLKLVGSALGATLTGTGNSTLEGLLNLVFPLILPTFNQFLVFDVQITVAKGSQAIAFGTAPSSIVVGTTGIVSATGGPSGNPVTFSSNTPSICSVSGATVTGIGAGTCTIAANQAGDANYNAAPQVTQSLAIGKGSQAITFGQAPTIFVGLTGVVSAAGGPSANAVTFTSTSTGVCTVGGTNGSTVTGVSAGTCTIAANQAGNANYNAAPQVNQNVTITGNASSVVDLSVTQVPTPSPAGTNKDVVFTLTLGNAGPGAASPVTLTDTLPAGTTFIWASPGCAQAAGTVTCGLGSLASGASVQVKVVVRASAAGSITNTAGASGSQSESNYTNNSSSSSVTVNASPAALAIPRYRLYSDVTKEHHFTTDLNEYNTLGTYVGTWVQEGTVGKVLNGPGSFNGVTAVPYYRLYDTSTRWHHWTTDANEYYTLIQYPWWNGEGVDGYILPTPTAGATQLYRLNYPALGSLHHWTIDANEYNTLISTYGWIGEGGSGFVVQ